MAKSTRVRNFILLASSLLFIFVPAISLAATVSFSTPTWSTGANIGSISVSALDSTHIVFAISDTINGYGGAGVANVPGILASFGNYGSPVFNSAPTTAPYVATLDATHFVIAYEDGGNNHAGTAIIGTFSGIANGNAISFGAPVVFSGASGVNNPMVAVLDATHVVVSYEDGGNTNAGIAIIGTISGNTISFGTPVVFNNTTTTTSVVSALNSTRFVIAYEDDGNSGKGTAIAGTISGNNISFGAPVVFNNAITITPAISSNDSTHVVIAYDDGGNSNIGTAIVASISGNAISFGTPVTFNGVIAANPTISATDANHVVIAYNDGGNVNLGNPIAGASNAGTAIVGTISGSTISFGVATIFPLNNDSVSLPSITPLDSSRVAISYLDSGNNNYGTTSIGSLWTNGRLLHTFAGYPTDGAYPSSNTPILVGGKLYGTTNHGGSRDYGMLFSMNTDGSNYSDLYDFDGTLGLPVGKLVSVGSKLYGMTNAGGAFPGGGAIFSINTDGTGLNDLHDFDPGIQVDNGGNPFGSLILSNNTLYGMTNAGGANGAGTIFSMDTNGNNFTILHSFNFNGTSDGAYPFYGSLVLNNNMLYGTTLAGGIYNLGIIFSISTDGSGFTDIHDFDGQAGSTPYGGLVLSGTTLYGSALNQSSAGVLYSINTDGSNFTILSNQLAVPVDTPIISGSTIYGVTSQGGPYSVGTIYSISTNGSGLKILHSFGGGSSDGVIPSGSLIISGSDLYGMTMNGGSPNYGTIFTNSISPASSNPLVPIITSISPDTKNAGDASFILTIDGSNFLPQAIAQFNGSDRSTTYISATQLTVSIPASDVAAAGSFPITVYNNVPSGGTSNSVTLTVNNPGPTITSITPSSASQGSSVNMTVQGSGFTNQSIIYFGNLALSTNFGSSSSLTTSFTAPAPGTYSITVVNPAPGGGTSNSVSFTVTPPVPTADNLTTSDPSQYCPVQGSTAVAYFSWTYNDVSGLNESQFQIQIDDNADFSSPEVDRTVSGLSNPPGSSNQQAVFINTQAASDSLTYNHVYHWRVKVVDSSNADSGWQNGATYTTAAHSGPTVAFTYSPANPASGDIVSFTNNSVCYNASGPTPCQSYLWDFGDGTSSTLKNPTHIYSTVSSFNVSLRVFDDLGSCVSTPGSYTISTVTRSNLPKWKEVSPLH